MDRTIGQVAALAGVTVRTLHHYDEVGLLRPSGRSTGGYRVYDEADLERLHRVLAYRELGFSLEQVAEILDDPQADTASHLRRQHAVVRQRIERLTRVLDHIRRPAERGLRRRGRAPLGHLAGVGHRQRPDDGVHQAGLGADQGRG